MKKLFLLLAAIFCFTTTAMATPISGNINFSGNCSYLGGSTPSDATGIHFLPGYTLLGNTGDYVPIPSLTPVTFNDFYFRPDMVPSPVNPLWTLTYDGIIYNFVMNSVNYSVGAGGTSLTLVGTGILGITGFDDTPGNWEFTTQGDTAILSFSANSEAVPEPSTLLLLGAGFLGLGIFGRRRMNNA